MTPGLDQIVEIYALEKDGRKRPVRRWSRRGFALWRNASKIEC
jgi:hypothetical protein